MLNSTGEKGFDLLDLKLHNRVDTFSVEKKTLLPSRSTFRYFMSNLGMNSAEKRVKRSILFPTRFVRSDNRMVLYSLQRHSERSSVRTQSIRPASISLPSTSSVAIPFFSSQYFYYRNRLPKGSNSVECLSFLCPFDLGQIRLYKWRLE